jgi:hypothetical protein
MRLRATIGLIALLGIVAGEDLDRQVAQQPGKSRPVVAGVGDDQDVRIAGPPLPGGDQPADQLP